MNILPFLLCLQASPGESWERVRSPVLPFKLCGWPLPPCQPLAKGAAAKINFWKSKVIQLNPVPDSPLAGGPIHVSTTDQLETLAAWGWKVNWGREAKARLNVEFISWLAKGGTEQNKLEYCPDKWKYIHNVRFDSHCWISSPSSQHPANAKKSELR